MRIINNQARSGRNITSTITILITHSPCELINKCLSFYMFKTLCIFVIFALSLTILHSWRQPYTVNQHTPTPPMGWNGWNTFRCNDALDENFFKQTADTLVTSGMKDAGYKYVILDDCWQIGRDEEGNIIPDPKKFPSGMKNLADYIHSKGLKFGIYTSAGRKTCEGRPGSVGHEHKDVQTYTLWGVDYIKVDWCDADYLDPKIQFRYFRDAIEKAGRPIVLSASFGEPNKFSPWIWGRYMTNLWRTTSDIQDDWTDILRIIIMTSRVRDFGGQGAWNDPDMLPIGIGGMTHEEYKTNLIMWAMLSAPLIAGNDIHQMNMETQNLLTHEGIIAIDQDQLGLPAQFIGQMESLYFWDKRLFFPFTHAFALVNMGDESISTNINLSDLGIVSNFAYIKNIYTNVNEGLYIHSYPVKISPHDTVLIKAYALFKNDFPFNINRAVTSFLSDKHFIAMDGYGKNKTISLDSAYDELNDSVILLSGKLYPKGIGVSAGTEIIYPTEGKCSDFTSTIGIDDSVTNTKAGGKFQIMTDGKIVYQSKEIFRSDSPLFVYVNLNNIQQITLKFFATTDLDKGNSLYGDWANAEVTCN